jgi:hypothetical protein
MAVMKNVISQLIDDFHERNLPELVTRNKEFSEVRGKADVVIGMTEFNLFSLPVQQVLLARVSFMLWFTSRVSGKRKKGGQLPIIFFPPSSLFKTLWFDKLTIKTGPIPVFYVANIHMSCIINHAI